MLLVDGQQVHGSLSTLLELPCLQHACTSFLSHLTAAQPCSQQVPENGPPYLCLIQGEEAVIDINQLPNLVIGSQDATTCMVALCYCAAQQLVWCAHIDQALCAADVQVLVNTIAQMQQPQLYLAGAYCDSKGIGPRTAQAFLQIVHSLSAAVELCLCCVAAANTAPDGSPCTCSLVLDTATNTVHPWTFKDRGPEVPRRMAAMTCRWWGADSRNPLMNVWCPEQQQLVLQPFDPSSIDSWTIMQCERMINLSDEQLLQVYSTSPEHEPDWFCEDMRNKMRFLVSAQEPHSVERQAASVTARYSWSSSCSRWVPACGSQGDAAGSSRPPAEIVV